MKLLVTLVVAREVVERSVFFRCRTQMYARGLFKRRRLHPLSEKLRDNLLQAFRDRHPAAIQHDQYDAELLQAWLDRLYAEDIPDVHLPNGSRAVAPGPPGHVVGTGDDGSQ